MSTVTMELLQKAGDNIDIKKALDLVAKGNRTFEFCGSTLSISGDINKAASLSENSLYGSTLLSKITSENNLKETLGLLKASHMLYPGSSLFDSMLKAKKELNDSREIERRLEKAKKGTPQYEEWLRKFREKKGHKASAEITDTSKSKAKEVLDAKGKPEGKVVSVSDKDWSRMVDVAFADHNVSTLINSKDKAIARAVAQYKLQGKKELPKYLGDFGDRAIELGATREDLATSLKNAPEPPEKYQKLMKQAQEHRYGDRFVGRISRSLDNFLKDKGVAWRFSQAAGNANTYEGKAAMSRNGRKWTEGYTLSVSKGGKTKNYILDAVTDEGDGPTRYVLGGYGYQTGLNETVSSLINSIKNDFNLTKAQDMDLNKAKKGTPQYDEWLRKWKEKHGVSTKEEESKKEETYKRPKKETLKERKILAGISTLNDKDIKAALDAVKVEGSTTKKIKGVNVTFITDNDSTTVMVPSPKPNGGVKQAFYVETPVDKLTRKDMGEIASTINKVITQFPEQYLPHRIDFE